jgi:hypothetical protein
MHYGAPSRALGAYRGHESCRGKRPLRTVPGPVAPRQWEEGTESIRPSTDRAGLAETYCNVHNTPVLTSSR